MSTRDESHDVSLAALDDYVSGVTDDANASRLEAALFDAAARGEDIAFVDRIARDAEHLHRHGTYHPGMTQRDADALRASGRRVAWLELAAGERIATVRFPRTAEFMVVRSPFDLSGVNRIDVEIEIPGVGVIKTMRDIVFDPRDNALFACCEAPLAIQAARARSIWHCYSVEGDVRRELAAMTLQLEIVD